MTNTQEEPTKSIILAKQEITEKEAETIFFDLLAEIMINNLLHEDE